MAGRDIHGIRQVSRLTWQLFGPGGRDVQHVNCGGRDVQHVYCRLVAMASEVDKRRKSVENSPQQVGGRGGLGGGFDETYSVRNPI